MESADTRIGLRHGDGEPGSIPGPWLRFFLGSASGLTNWLGMISTQPGNAMAAVRATDAWFTPWRFAALLGLLIVACFPHVIAGLETFFYRDYAAFGYPLAFFHKES